MVGASKVNPIQQVIKVDTAPIRCLAAIALLCTIVSSSTITSFGACPCSSARGEEDLLACLQLHRSSANDTLQLYGCKDDIQKSILSSAGALPGQSLLRLCSHTVHGRCSLVEYESRKRCLEKLRSAGRLSAACREEYVSYEDFQQQQQSIAASGLECCSSEPQGCDCQAALADLTFKMPEDWAQEAALLKSCPQEAHAFCHGVSLGYGRLNACLQEYAGKPTFSCNLPPIGGQRQGAPQGGKVCSVAIVSTYPPTKCGLATFTSALLEHLRKSAALQSCHIGVIAISDPQDGTKYNSPDVEFNLLYDKEAPSPAMLEAVHFIHKSAFTHVIIQQEFGLTPIMWQLADVARWLDPAINVFTVVHTPRATPNVEERGILRVFSQFSYRLIVMTWYGWHSLVAAYGIDPEKIVYIPHGVEIPSGNRQGIPVQPELGHSDGAWSLHTVLSSSRSMLEKQPNIQSPDRSSAGTSKGANIILSNGLFTRYKRLDRVVLALPQVLEQHPDTYLLLVGRESSTEALKGQLMENLLDLAAAGGVEDHLLWIDDFINTQDLQALMECSAAYVAVFDEATPTSGTLLSAMSHRLPVVATPFRHALEVLQGNRGFIVPFNDNGTHLAHALNAILASTTLQDYMGLRALEGVQNWNWDAVAQQYAELLSEGSTIAVTGDSFAKLQMIEQQVWWQDQTMRLLTGDEWNFVKNGKPSHFSKGTYALWVDNDVQVNGAVDESGRLVMVGIANDQWWSLLSTGAGIDYEFNPAVVSNGKWPENSGLYIDLKDMIIRVETKNADMHFQLLDNGVALNVKLKQRFASPQGVLGMAYCNTLDASCMTDRTPFTKDIWTHWSIPQQLGLFSTEAPGQVWDMTFGRQYRSNVRWLPEHALQRKTFDPHKPLQEANATILLRFEGALFGKSGIAQVNRRYWLHLKRQVLLNGQQHSFDIQLHPQEMPHGSPVKYGILEHLVRAAFAEQKSHGENGRSLGKLPGIIFRNQWPPSFAQPEAGFKYIHQQAFEFDGIPEAWLGPLNTLADQIWVPSLFNRDLFANDGVIKAKLQVIPHGIELTKFEQPVLPADLPWKDRFVFLFNGGLLPRKGIDVLLQAYTKTFTSKDEVALIVHSSYGDDFWKEEVLQAQQDASQPSILFLQDVLTDVEMLRLFKAADVYVSPHRSEGFGLSTLEALAMNLQVLITDFGPARETCLSEQCIFIKATPTSCSVKPCSVGKIFGQTAVHDPSWAEPNQEHLESLMMQLYLNRSLMWNVLAPQTRVHIDNMSWYKRHLQCPLNFTYGVQGLNSRTNGLQWGLLSYVKHATELDCMRM